MIRIKEDKRMQHSAQLLMDGLVKCMEQKPFEEIAISDIQKSSGVSRATFYRLFDNTQDLLEYQCQQIASTIQEEYQKQSPSRQENFFLFSLRYWLDNAAFLDALYRCKRMDVLSNAIMEHAQFLKELLPIQNISSDKMDYVVSVSVGILGSILMVWIKNGKRESVDDLIKVFFDFNEIMPSLLHDVGQTSQHEK